jgi:hypothetical protein
MDVPRGTALKEILLVRCGQCMTARRAGIGRGGGQPARPERRRFARSAVDAGARNSRKTLTRTQDHGRRRATQGSLADQKYAGHRYKTKSNVLLGRAEHGRPRRATPRITPAVLAQGSWRTVCAHPVQSSVRRATEEQRCYRLPPEWTCCHRRHGGV